jgi:feruloyl-CoA synthase
LIFPAPGASPDHNAFRERLTALAKTATGSSNHVSRAIVLETQPQVDASEVTDKGSINQRAVMAARAADVEALYAEPPPPRVMVFPR